MTQEKKQLLILCAMLPYDTIVNVDNGKYREDMKLLPHHIAAFKNWDIKPYLLPMSSMTEKEYETFPIPYSFDSFSTWNNTILSEVIEGTQILIGIDEITEIIDWLNAHHFDYRGLIEKGLAIEAPEDMYNF